MWNQWKYIKYVHSSMCVGASLFINVWVCCGHVCVFVCAVTCVSLPLSPASAGCRQSAGGPWGWPRPAPACPTCGGGGRDPRSCPSGCAGLPWPAVAPPPEPNSPNSMTSWQRELTSSCQECVRCRLKPLWFKPLTLPWKLSSDSVLPGVTSS